MLTLFQYKNQLLDRTLTNRSEFKVLTISRDVLQIHMNEQFKVNL